MVYPPRKSFYELLSEQFGGSAIRLAVSAWLSANLSKGELEALRADARPARDVPPRRAAGADAVHVLAVIGLRSGLGPDLESPTLTDDRFCSASRLTSIFIFCFAFGM